MERFIEHAPAPQGSHIEIFKIQYGEIYSQQVL